MPKACRSLYNLAFKLKVVAEAVDNNSAIMVMVRYWRKDQVNLLNGELKMSAKRKAKGCYSPKLLAKVSWIGFQSREVKVSLSFFSFKTMKCLEQLISVRSCCNVYTNRGNDRF